MQMKWAQGDIDDMGNVDTMNAGKEESMEAENQIKVHVAVVMILMLLQFI